MSEETEIAKFVEFVTGIINKPGLYGVNKIEDIYFIILGYRAAMTGLVNVEQLNKFLYRFRKFVNEHFETKSDTDWCRLIRFYSGSDLQSIDLFGKLFSNFFNEEPKNT